MDGDTISVVTETQNRRKDELLKLAQGFLFSHLSNSVRLIEREVKSKMRFTSRNVAAATAKDKRGRLSYNPSGTGLQVRLFIFNAAGVGPAVLPASPLTSLAGL